jgi:hypothetical protein
LAFDADLEVGADLHGSCHHLRECREDAVDLIDDTRAAAEILNLVTAVANPEVKGIVTDTRSYGAVVSLLQVRNGLISIRVRGH